jgi:hypothetical protein
VDGDEIPTSVLLLTPSYSMAIQLDLVVGQVTLTIWC